MYRPRHHGTSLPGVVWGLVLKKAGKGGHTVIIMAWWGLALKKVGEGSTHRCEVHPHEMEGKPAKGGKGLIYLM
jgi:hypothetical protein